ncbi:MAG: ABC transporter permease subunit [Desulfobacterales bacterium]|nr:ABC transporter permease subunit [Desulfobacterales bacterium]
MQSESLAHGVFALAAFFSAAVTLMVFIFMAVLGLPVIEDGQFFKILWGPWSPDHHNYGIRPMILGTLCIALFGLLVAVPVSLGCAFFISVTAPKGPARILHRLVQFMTGIPTVIYGFVGIFLLVPLVREISGRGSGLCILTAGLLLAVLVAPTMILFFAEGLAKVPRAYCHAVTALGGTPVQRLVYVMLPQAWRSILAGLVLGFGRAVGDTMIALMLAGNAVAPPESMLDAARTLTAHIALIIAADFDSIEFRTLFICGLTLYLATTLAVVVMRRVATNRMEIP